MINNITELLLKFDAINFEEYEDKKFIKGDWVLRYRIDMSEIFGLQIIFNLTYRNHNVQTWGCVDDDNKAAIKWIKQAKYRINEYEFRLDNNAQSIGKQLFQEL
jgi:hypothetical protein